MAANDNKRKSLYDQLTGDGYDLGDFQSFSTNLDDSTKRRNLYDAITKDNYDVGDYDSFSRKLDEEASANQPGIVAQQVVDEWEQAAKQSSMNTGAVLNENPAGPQRQPAQSPEEDKRTLFANHVQEQLGNIDKELNKPREALPMPAGSAFIPSTAVAAAQRYGNAQTREQQDRYTSLKAARNFLDEANKVVTEAGKKGKTNFVAGALRGIRDKGFDPDTWMMGISETSYYNLLRQAAEKEERGETLSAEEQQLLDAAAVNMAANAYYASDLGRGYKAGSVTAESIPFMLQFAVNPLSGVGKGLAKTILNHGIKRFGLNTAKRTLAGRAVRGAARVAGDAVAAAGVTATTGLGNVAEDAERRMAGDVQFAQDGQGNIRYAGRVNNVEDTGEAIARAFASTFFENQSEMVGNYFAPIMRGVSGLVKRIPGVKQLSASKVGELYRGIKNNPTYKEFTDRTQWHGAIGEYAEEVYNNLASVAMGDMTPEELVDLNNNIDTFLGVGLMSAVFGGIGAAGFARDRYTLNRDIRRFEADLTPEEMERWQDVKQVATSGDVEGVREFVKYTMRDDSLTPQEKKDEIAYIYNVMKQSAMEGVAAEQTEEAVEAETQDILAHSDQSANTYTECNRIVVNDVGEMVEQPGHIVGYMGGQPLWIPDGAEPGTAAIPLKEGEYNPESIQSMPTQEVIDETAQAIREDAAEQARRESTYSQDIVSPSIGTTFTDGVSQYQIVQQNPDGGWLATRTTVDDKGKTVQEVVPVTEQEYLDLMQAQIDAQEAAARTVPANQAQTLNVSGSNTEGSSRIDKPAENLAPAKSRTSSDEVENVTSSSRELDNTSIPTDEKGNLLYHRAPVERTVSSINAEGLEPDEVDAFISANKDAAAKQLKSIEGKAPKMGTNIAKYKADKAAWQARVGDAQAQVDYWNRVGETIAAQRTQVGDTTAEDIRSMGEPMNGHELAAMMLAAGRLPLLQSDFKRETGYKGGEARNLFGLFASEANGGMTIERAGEQLMLADQEDGTNFFDPDDPNAGRNAILDVLSEVRTRGDLTNYIRRNREALAERERQAEYDAYADWCDEVMHLTPEEYEAYQEYIAANNPYEGVAVEELDRIFAESEEAYHNYIISQNNGQEGTSENGSEADSGPSERDEPAGEAGGREASVPVLPGAQPVLQGQEPGRAGGIETASGPADDGVRAAERTVAEGASGGEGRTDSKRNPVDNDGRLITERVNDFSEISDADFTHPTRNIELPKLPDAVDEAIGANGKPVIIKRNIFARNAQRHGDLSPENSREILREALYNPSLYGQNQKAKKPYNWVLINVPDANGNNRVVLLEVNHHKDNVEIVHWHYVDERGLEKIRRQAEREDGQLLILPSVTSEEVGALSDPTLSLSSEGKGSDSSANSQTNNGFIAPERQADENLLDYAERVAKVKEIDDARKEVSANPTEAQKEAGNYKKGHITLDGYDITIENPKGSTRRGVDANGQPWSVTMNNDYGYIRGTEGVDGDHIDVFLSDDPTTGKVYVIDQVKEDGSFDEHKVMYGFKSALAAKRAYLANYSPDWKGLGTISEVSKEEFRKWVDSSHRKTKPFAEYKNVKVEGAQSEESNALQNQTQKRYRLLQSFVSTKDGKLKKKYADTFKKPLYAIFDSNKPNSEPFYIASSPRDALNAAFNYDMENFDVLYVNAPEKEVELGTYSLLTYGQDASYDSDGAFREEIKQRLAEDIGKLGPARLEESNIETDNDHLPDAGEMNRVQEEAEKIQQQSGPVEKIEDVGEKIGGAKKDRFKEFAEKEKQLQEKPDSFMEELRKLPVSKIFNFNLEALRKDGLGNEAATLIDVIRRVIPSKPRTDWKLKRWVSDVFGLYRFCLTLATAEQGTFDTILERVTNIKQIGGMYRAQMSLGGFDSGVDTGQATLEELGDSAGHYDKDDNWVSLKGQWYVAHAGRYGGIYPDYEKAKEALAQFAGENSKGKEKGTEVKFSVYSYKNSGEAFITLKGKPNIVVESGFKSSKEAMDYLNEHMDELQAKYRNMKDSTSIGFAPNSERRGKDWRGGKDVTAEDFRNTFGFRGVEFGNWANQQERQRALNQAYDAFMDLSEATGISPRGLSLGGELGMAFGARGGGGAAAHYEPGKVVINLTKTQGAGTLAHEWWHAIDNYFSRRRGQALGYNTERKGYNLPIRGGKVEREHEAERKEITNAFADLMKAINGSSYGERSNAYASLKSSYWKEPTELGARAFAVWVERKLSEKGIVNNFLANNNTIGWESPELKKKYYPYPLESDFESLDVAFDNLFGAIEEKVDEETGNTVLYREAENELSQVNERFNDELSQLTENNADKVVLSLGKPSTILRAAGVEDKPMKLYGNKVIKKMKKHGFKLNELQNLPEAVANPIAVFKNYGKEGNRSILTELKTEQGNFLVTLTLGEGHDVDFNVVTSVFGKGKNNIVDWIKRDFATYINKEKTLNYLHHSALKAVTSDNQEFSDATKIVENFENPIIEDEILRGGAGILSDSDLSAANDPVSKLLGKSTRTVLQRKEFAERERRNMTARVQELAGKLHLDNVEIVNEPMAITDRKGKTHYPKGFYNRATDKIVIVIPNNSSTFDAEQTLLHEAVAHYGLRRLFGEHFDTFLDNVFNNADVKVRRKIVALAQKNGWDIRLATEEYLASLAEETNFDNLDASWWRKIKDLFLRMLHKIGFEDFSGVTLTDNELRYILWRSYENLREPGRYRSILGQAEDIAKQYELKVGNYAPTASNVGQVAESANSAKAERIRKLLESKPVEIKGEEYRGKYELNRDSAQKYVLDTLRGEYTIKDTGEKVNLSKVGAKKVTSHSMGNEAHLKSIAAIPQLISNAIFIEERPPYKEGAQYDFYRYYVTGLKINGEDYTVRMTIGVKNGKYYYDHYLTNIEKGNLIEIAQGFTPTEDAPNPSYAEVKDTKLLSILQDNSEENLLFREADNEKDAESMNTESPSPISTPTVEAWDKLANSFKFQLRETAVDHLTAVEKFQDLVAKHSGKEIQTFENAYNLMLALSSKTKNEMDMFDSFLVRPLNKAILGLVGGKGGIRKWSWDKGPLRELVMYVEAKHGAERNRQMAVEKLAKGDASEESILKDWSEAKKRINARKDLSWMEKQWLLDEEAAKPGADLSKDYSGLSSVFKDAEKYPKGWKESAWEYVEQYEKEHDTKDIDALWNAISNATGYALQKQYESGLVSKEYVERQKDRFENYVPLREFADEIAGDVYNYMGNDFYPGGNPVKKAEGRTSEAGNPFGSILNTAYASMSTGNKNMAKLALYSLVVNHDTGGLAITNRAWMVKYDELKGNKELGELLVIPKIPAGEEMPEWVEAVPKMPEKATSEEITEVLKRFEEAMNKYQQADVTKPVGKKAKTAYRTLYHERDQHDIPLYIAGDKYVITVTGNPRLAQAMNGLLNPDVNNDVASAFGKRVQRFMAGAFTAKNAAFALGNLSKDSMYANNQAFIRENPKYWWRFTKNQRLGFGDFQPMMRRLHKYREGKLDMNDKTERLFKEFMDNGGATGYTFVNSQDEYARELAKKLKDLSRKTPEWFTPKGTLKLFFDLVEFAGQSAELVNRFAAYKTSREMGRSINRSIIDAKEITVNFNRKGAGLKTSKVNRSTKGDESLLGGFKPIDIFAFISQYGSSSIIFWNANMQAKYRLYKNLKEHPVRTSTTLIANSMVIGAVAIPLLNNLLLPALYDVLGWSSGDDDEDYYDVLTDWERTHNICIRLPEGYWLKIPLSPEMSPWYSMGDAIFGAASGKRDLSATDFIKSAIDAVSPFSINWSYGDRAFLLNFLPSVGKPIAEVMLNTNFMGNPLYKTPFSGKQGFTPEYKLVYNSASPTLIELSRLSNRVAGGSDLKTSGKWKDWNPATLQNLISGYTGGYGTTMLSVADWIVGTSHGEKQAVTFSRMPLVSRFVISGNKDVKLKRINSPFYKVRDFVNEFEYDRKSLEDAIRESRKSGDMLKMADYISQLEDLFDSDRAKKYVQLKDLVDASKRYEDYLKEFPEDETTRNLLYGIKMEGIERLRE